MNFPIPVNMTVDSGEAIQMTVQGDVTVSCVVDLRISPNVQETYDGPYSVTPSESVQTLETDDKSMTDDVTVGAIPADYIGSSVPRKTSADLTASGPTVTAPAGYYAEAATKSVAVGSARVYDTAIPVTPSISVDNSGKITASVSKVQSVSPSVNAGSVTAGYAGNMSVSGSAELQMTTQAAQTITPTTTDQTIASDTYLTGAQTIKGDSALVGANIVYGSSIFGVAGDVVPLQVSQDPVTNVLSIS